MSELPYKEDFLVDLANNNYSPETVYSYGRDLLVFEAFLDGQNCEFEDANKRIISLYKGFLRSGKHLELLEEYRERRNVDMAGKSRTKRSKGSRNDESLEGIPPTPGEDEKSRRNGDSGDSGGPRISQGSRTAQAKKLSSRTVNRMLSALRSYLKYLIDFDYPCPIPPESIKMIKTERKEAQVAELDELITLIEAPMQFEKDKRVKLRNRAMLELLFSTGMRISELINLDREQISRSDGRIYVLGKGKKQRFVYLTERARVHLENYLATRKDDSPALFIPYRGGRKGHRGSRISPNYLQAKIALYRRLLGIVVPTSAHSLRHGFATYLAEEGANPAAIQILLGHESLHTTDRYVHASDRYAEETHKKHHPLRK